MVSYKISYRFKGAYTHTPHTPHTNTHTYLHAHTHTHTHTCFSPLPPHTVAAMTAHSFALNTGVTKSEYFKEVGHKI